LLRSQELLRSEEEPIDSPAPQYRREGGPRPLRLGNSGNEVRLKYSRIIEQLLKQLAIISRDDPAHVIVSPVDEPYSQT
jgi:hypothetical protein